VFGIVLVVETVARESTLFFTKEILVGAVSTAIETKQLTRDRDEDNAKSMAIAEKVMITVEGRKQSIKEGGMDS
jgi:hypothetical protein